VLLPVLVLVATGISHGAESEFLGPNRERLTVWSRDGSDLTCELRTEAGTFHADTRLADGVHRGPLTARREDSEETPVVGELFLRIVAGDAGEAIVILAGRGTDPVAPDPSGTYRRLDRGARLQLARERHGEADAALNAAYRRVMDLLPEGGRADLRQRQWDWIEYRDSIAALQAELDEEANGDPGTSARYWESLAELTEARTGFLETYGRGNRKGRIDGLWVDEAGGRMVLSLATGPAGDAGLRFDISVARGPSNHPGEIQGFAPFADPERRLAVFLDTDPEAAVDGKAARIEFLFDGERMEVRAENTDYYHGARAYFDGTFFREGPLNGESSPGRAKDPNLNSARGDPAPDRPAGRTDTRRKA